MFTRNLVIHIIKMLQSIFVFAAKVPSVGGEYGFSLELHSVISLQWRESGRLKVTKNVNQLFYHDIGPFISMVV